jgi:hypothetical protein
MILFCLKPEAWPAAARYPSRFTVIPLVLDPANASKIDVDKTPGTLLITDRDIVMPGPLGGGETRYPITALTMYGVKFPEKDKTATFDADTVRHYAPRLAFFLGSLVTLGQIFGDVLWAAMMLFFVGPLITITASVGERSLLLPRRAAYRMAAALLIPLLLFNGFMHAAGYPISGALGGEGAWLTWFAAAAALGVWTGVMARHIYGQTRKAPPRQT